MTRREAINIIEKRRKSGETLAAIAKDMGFHFTNYYEWVKRGTQDSSTLDKQVDLKKTKREYKSRSSEPHVQTIELKDDRSDKCAIIICKTSDLKSVLGGLL